MDTEHRIAAEWAAAKTKQLANGYASQWDRRTARLIRKHEASGIETTAAQRKFAAKVESIIGSNHKTR